MPTSAQDIDRYRRSCPGEEEIMISDAVCFGRRRNNFPMCKGCQFNDEETKAGQAAPASVVGQSTANAEEAKRDRIESVFRAHDVRGTCPDPLDSDVAWRIGMATAQLLRSELRGYDRSQPEKAAVVVGMDMRKSSPGLLAALTEGLRAGGSPVIDIGMIDTPLLWFAVNQLTCCGGVQVTGSHEPAGSNGFRICGRKGRPVSAETGLGKICKIAKNTVRHSTSHPAGLQQQDLGEAYREFVRGFLKQPGGGINADRPLKMVVDASNGMAGRWLPITFDEVDWLEIVRLNFEHDGEFMHEPNPLAEHNLAQLKDRCQRSKADIGVCFDGDADRLALLDNQGRLVPADLVIALLARHLLKAAPGATVVYDLCCSRAVPEEILKAGGVARRERCGHPFLKRALEGSKGIFAGQRGGRYYFRDNWYCDSGLIALAQILNILTASGRPLNELIAPIKRYAHSGERSFHADNSSQVIRELTERYGNARIDHLEGITVEYEDWWFNVRPSSTESVLRLNLEAADEAMLESKLAEVCPLLGTPVGPPGAG